MRPTRTVVLCREVMVVSGELREDRAEVIRQRGRRPALRRRWPSADREPALAGQRGGVAGVEAHAVDVDAAAHDVHVGLALPGRARARSLLVAVDEARPRSTRRRGSSPSRRGRPATRPGAARRAWRRRRSASARSSARCRAAFGSIQICRKCVVSFGAWLNSLCWTPLPALIRCTSPGRITPVALPARRCRCCRDARARPRARS